MHREASPSANGSRVFARVLPTAVLNEESERVRAHEAQLSTLRSGTIPADVLAAVAAEPARDRFNLAGTIDLKQQIVKAETITINDKGLLVLSGVHLPWVAFVAKRVLIETPQVKATVTRPIGTQAESAFANALRGAEGAPGSRGADGQGFNQHRHGNSGDPGTDAATGDPGRTQLLPIVYFLAGAVETQDGSPPSQANLRFDLLGVRGGEGGRGGRGGDGGHGHHGDIGRSEFLSCQQAAGTGGRGGDPGRGGRGGTGGTGGSGGTIVFGAPTTTIGHLRYFEVLQEAGPAGGGGKPGSQGTKGIGGDGGAKNKWCDAGRRGDDGKDIVGDLGHGDDGGPGQRGDIFEVVMDVDALF